MIGGEAAEHAALERRHVADDVRDPYELGWVVDWLYGDAVLPPMPLPQPDPLPFRHRTTPVPAPMPAVAEPRRAGKPRRRTRQLALL